MATNTLHNEKILKLGQQKINNIQSAIQREPDNDDIMFFKSKLPFVSKIPTKKLRFRSCIQEIVENLNLTPAFTSLHLRCTLSLELEQEADYSW